MKKIFFPALLLTLIATSCRSTSTGIFSKKTPLEKYGEKLEDDGLKKTPEGRQWLAASERALQLPVAVSLPYRQAGKFSAAKPQAMGLAFTAKHGERILFTLTKNAADNFVLYAELYKKTITGEAKLVQAVDTNVTEFSYDVTEAGDYVLKIQPQLLRVGNYELSIASGPSLLFPVAGKKAYIGSVWGDARDGGKRSHEGVDIFAAKRTPAIAAADGVVAGVREGGIGGKTVWLRPEGQNITLYYAHLDEQLVSEGQLVKRGDTLGLVGNTGNAQFTPPHLHFGVYGYGGALNPFPFVNRQLKTPPAIPQKKLAGYVRLVKDLQTVNGQVKKNTLLLPLAYTAKGYIAELPDGFPLLVSFSAVQEAAQPLGKKIASTATAIYPLPGTDAVPAATLSAGTSVLVLGYFNQYAFVRNGKTEGWVLDISLKG
jgi:murein DD-endopeptidase MepM/ murein hydrolase activator NlpD